MRPTMDRLLSCFSVSLTRGDSIVCCVCCVKFPFHSFRLQLFRICTNMYPKRVREREPRMYFLPSIAVQNFMYVVLFVLSTL
ncbi:hypothetical protein BJV78DRAFT_1185735 [Lactifluus subvellereus]|nr:hypothetical protein BJV78DRAFT_1185735 [Lactifluus subvellereus]